MLSVLLCFSQEQRAITARREGDGGGACGQEADEEWCCPICLEAPEAVCVLPECFHHLCRVCLQRAAAGGTSFRCPLCRAPVESWHVSVYRIAAASQTAAEAAPAGLHVDAVAWRQLPSKLRRLLGLVHEILHPTDEILHPTDEILHPTLDPAASGSRGAATARAAPTALTVPDASSSSPQQGEEEEEEERVLVYTQWLAHVEHIGATLDAAGIPSLRMSGSLASCMASLQAFGRRGAPRVLVLSSQHHASGINLQVARNLIIVHPYCTPSATRPEFVSFKQLHAFEQQAIGRIRRYPRTEPVRVWRLIGRDSVEEGLYRGQFTETPGAN